MTIRPSGPFQPKIALVGELPHEMDLQKGEPFVGGPGLELTKMLQEAGTSRESCYLTMVCKDRVPGNKMEHFFAFKKKEITARHIQYNGQWILPELVTHIEALREELLRVKPNVVCAMGNLALFALCGQYGVTNWRSSILESTLIPGLKVIPTYTPAMIVRQWSLRAIMIHDLKRVVGHRDKPQIVREPVNMVIRPDFTEAHAYLSDILAKANHGPLTVGADIETRAGHISCIAFAPSPEEAICIPLMTISNPEGYWTEDEEAHLLLQMQAIFRHPNITIAGQNWNYDAQYIDRYWGVRSEQVSDTMIQHHSCFSNLPKNLAFLSSMYLDDHYYWKDDRTGWSEDDGGEDVYWRYNCTDAVRTLKIHNVLSSVIPAMGMSDVYAFQQHLSNDLVLKAMKRGVRIDQSKRTEFGLRLMEQFIRRQDELNYITESELNIKSPKQMSDFFYRQMGMKPIFDRKSGSITTKDEALQTLAAKEPILSVVTRRVSDMRSLGVFNSTFVQAPLDIDGRMRCTYNVAGTETYRFASSQNAFGTGMNMQNVPKGDEDAALYLPNIRSMFIPDVGMEIFDIDLDSADLRIVTWESDCQWMKDHFRNGRKPYIEVMREYYHDNTMTKDSHPHEYKVFKSLCHGTNYLGTAAGIAPRIGLLVHETERIQKWYYGMCPEIARWQERIKDQVSKRRYVENAWGYRNYFFDRIEGTIFNQAVAWIPQSTVACLINRGWSNIDKNLPEVEVLMQVHDSLVGQYPIEIAEWAKQRVLEETHVAIPYDDPLYIPVGIVTSQKSWGECN